MVTLLAQGTSLIECSSQDTIAKVAAIFVGLAILSAEAAASISYVVAPLYAFCNILESRHRESQLTDKIKFDASRVANFSRKDSNNHLNENVFNLVIKDVVASKKLSTPAKWVSFLCACAPAYTAPIVFNENAKPEHCLAAGIFGLVGPYISIRMEKPCLTVARNSRWIYTEKAALSYLQENKATVPNAQAYIHNLTSIVQAQEAEQEKRKQKYQEEDDEQKLFDAKALVLKSGGSVLNNDGTIWSVKNGHAVLSTTPAFEKQQSLLKAKAYRDAANAKTQKELGWKTDFSKS